MKHKYRLCSHRLMKQCVVNYWETYDTVVNCISVSSVLYISSIYELPSISIDFVLAFYQYDIDVDFFMDLPLVMVVD